MDPQSEQEPTPAEQDQYEFDKSQDRIIGDLSGSMRWVAGALMVVGILYTLALVTAIVRAVREPGLIFEAVFVGLATLFFFALAVWNRRSADAFRLITKTQGRDIDHLMEALDNLRRTFSVLSFLVKVYLLLVAIVLVGLMVVVVTDWFRG